MSTNVTPMEPRELSKEIQIGGEVYQVRRMSVWNSVFLLKFITEKCLPVLVIALNLLDDEHSAGTEDDDLDMVDDLDAENESEDDTETANEDDTDEEAIRKAMTKELDDDTLSKAIGLIPRLLETVSQKELKNIMTLCLNHADKSLAAGWQGVMVGKSFGIENIEFDTMTCLTLVWNVITFNCSNFFKGGGFNLQTAIQKLLKSPTR